LAMGLILEQAKMTLAVAQDEQEIQGIATKSTVWGLSSPQTSIREHLRHK